MVGGFPFWVVLSGASPWLEGAVFRDSVGLSGWDRPPEVFSASSSSHPYQGGDSFVSQKWLNKPE